MAQGLMEKATRATLKQLECDVSSDARARLAVVLAVALDGGAGMATAAIARELRATLSELENRNDGNSDEFAQLLADLSAPVVNTTD